MHAKILEYLLAMSSVQDTAESVIQSLFAHHEASQSLLEDTAATLIERFRKEIAQVRGASSEMAVIYPSVSQLRDCVVNAQKQLGEAMASIYADADPTAVLLAQIQEWNCHVPLSTEANDLAAASVRLAMEELQLRAQIWETKIRQVDQEFAMLVSQINVLETDLQQEHQLHSTFQEIADRESEECCMHLRQRVARLV